MRAVVCGANGAMGKLLCAHLGNEVAGKVSIDGENNVPRTFQELGDVRPMWLSTFPTTAPPFPLWSMPNSMAAPP